MATVDSGTETLFSDDSPCELIGSPSAGCGDEAEPPQPDLASRLAPPNIQPFSGVLEKGKVVIRPIAFKPTMTPSARFSDRYGSTPILTRPGSRLTLYGSSNDLHHGVANYSLDRKLRSSCQSTSSSPPLAMSSLTSLPHKLVNYDSLESVRKSPMSSSESTLLNKTSYRLAGGGGGSLLDLTPSPSDSGVSELEAALRDRDSELAYLRQTMEHNEQVIFRVYQEKERVWERELRRLKTLHENRLRSSTQRVLKLEQMLMMQTYQLQQDKKRLAAEAERSGQQNERLRQEVEVLRSRLEETEWGLCQKTGEISLLKSQLKDFQNEQNTKGHELIQLKNDYREVRDTLLNREDELSELKKASVDKDQIIDELRNQVRKLTLHINEASTDVQNSTYQSMEYFKEFSELRDEMSKVSLNNQDYESMDLCKQKRIEEYAEETEEDIEIQRLNMASDNDSIHSCPEYGKIKSELEKRKREFEKERKIWAHEKEKVLRYQRQLQMNYVQMYRRTRALEAEVENLTIELELDKTGSKLEQLPVSCELSQTIEL